LEAPHGATKQDLDNQGVGEPSMAWEEQLSSCSLNSENLQGLTEVFRVIKRIAVVPLRSQRGTLSLWRLLLGYPPTSRFTAESHITCRIPVHQTLSVRSYEGQDTNPVRLVYCPPRAGETLRAQVNATGRLGSLPRVGRPRGPGRLGSLFTPEPLGRAFR
jgi:hypothetical protein